MKCQACGKENDMNNKFCTGCGIQLLKNIINPNKTLEIILKIVNVVLAAIDFLLIFTYSAYVIIAGIVAIGAASASKDYSAEVKDMFSGVKQSVIIIIIVLIISIVFNIIVGLTMYKRNKGKYYIGKYKKINKVEYVLLALFFGTLGIHRFVIGDKKGGVLRLSILIYYLFSPLLIVILIPLFPNTKILTYILTVMLFCVPVGIVIGTGLHVSDFVIGLSKVSDENKMISI